MSRKIHNTMNTRPKFGTWYPADEAPPKYVGILIAGFEQGDREPVIADGFYDGENFKTHHYRESTVMDEVIAWMPKPEFPTGSKHWHTLPPKRLSVEQLRRYTEELLTKRILTLLKR